MSETSEWAKQQAQCITSVVPFWSTRALREDIEHHIALALDAARAVRPGCVRLDTGEELAVTELSRNPLNYTVYIEARYGPAAEAAAKEGV